jgi:hypothetical protein
MGVVGPASLCLKFWEEIKPWSGTHLIDHLLHWACGVRDPIYSLGNLMQ